jgi:hypothetical protein
VAEQEPSFNSNSDSSRGRRRQTLTTEVDEPVTRGYVRSVAEDLYGSMLSQVERCLQGVFPLELVAQLREVLEGMRQVHRASVKKNWYTTEDVAIQMTLAGWKTSPWTVREEWCHKGRIKAWKNPHTDKWEISPEVRERLLKEGPPPAS